MKNSICIPSFFKGRSFGDAVRCIAHYGFHAAELWGWQDLDLSESREILTENHVTLAAMCTTEFRMTDAKYRKDWLMGLEKSVKAAEKLSALMLISQVGPDTGEAREAQHENIVRCLTEAGEILEGSGVTLLIEPLNTYVDHPGYYLTSAQEGAEIVREAGRKEVRLLFDIYHQQIMEGNLIPNITSCIDVIGHFHAAGHPGRHELEQGETDYRNVFAAIGRLPYEGYIGLEYFPEKAPEESLLDFRKHYL